MYKDLQSSNVKEREDACKQIFKTVFHEIQHHRQYIMTQLNVSSKHSMIYAKEMCLKQILDSKFYSLDDDGNYYELAIENDANYIGASQYKALMKDNSRELTDEIRFYYAYLSESKYVIDCDTKDGKKHFKFDEIQEKNEGATKVLDETITEEYLVRYPILQKEYNRDGTKKDITELIINLNNEINLINFMEEIDEESKKKLIKDAQEMYYELIYGQMQSKPGSINETQKMIGTQGVKSILDDMIYYFLEEKERRILNCKILSEEKFLYDDQNSEEEYKKLTDSIDKYYNDKIELIKEVKQNIIEENER